MQLIRTTLSWLSILLVLGACATAPPSGSGADDEVSRLAAGIMALGPGIDPEEARRAARVALNHPLELRETYGVTDPPLIHNMKVNSGLRPRGLCWHWADDMETRLRQEQFKTLRLHRAIANADSAFRIEHSTVIISHLTGKMQDGMVLDPWRFGGTLYWSPVTEDDKYVWVARQKVFAMKRDRRARKQGRAATLSTPEPMPTVPAL